MACSSTQQRANIFTLDIEDTPILMFEAKDIEAAREICQETWMQDGLTLTSSGSNPLWDGDAELVARSATAAEIVVFADVTGMMPQSIEEIIQVYLVHLDPEDTRR